MTALYNNLLLLALLCLCLSFFPIYVVFFIPTQSWISVLFAAIPGVCLPLMSISLLWILSQRPPPRQTFRTLVTHLAVALAVRFQGKRSLRYHLASCKSPMVHQERLLQDIIQQNGDTKYGQAHRLKIIRTLEDFRKVHPLTSYEHFRPYVECMIEGDSDMMIPGKPDCFIRTTGTTGKAKYLPFKSRPNNVANLFSILIHVSGELFNVTMLKKSAFFYVAPEIRQTSLGVDIQPVSRLGENSDWMLSAFSTPPAGFRIGSLFEALYVHLLFGLLDSEVNSLVCGLVNVLMSAMSILESNWQQLVTDIAQGTLNSNLKLAGNIRKKLEEDLLKHGGNPQRANQLRKEFEMGFEGIIKRIWPLVSVIISVDTTDSLPKFRRKYAKDIPMLSMHYDCSEADLGLSVGHTYVDKGFVPLVTEVVFEFIRESDMDLDDPPTLFLDEVEIDQLYEIVLTQRYGLYRYRLGDVVRVLGFYENTPIIDFMYRSGQILNLRIEKLDQRVLTDSIRAAAGSWLGKDITEFAAAESTLLTQDSQAFEPDELMPYYIFFFELDSSEQTLSKDDKQLVDDEIRHRNMVYDHCRSDGSISRPRVHVVRSGTFDNLRHLLVTSTGAPITQYKVPRKLTTQDMVEFMLENLI